MIHPRNEELIRRINEYQECGHVHPLTCGNNSLHDNLYPEEFDGVVTLLCRDCDYKQTKLPLMFYANEFKLFNFL